MNGKYIGVVIGAVVAIMLVGSLLVPTINNANTTTKHDVPLPVGGQQIYYRFSEAEPTQSGNAFYTVALANGTVTITDVANSMTISLPVDTETVYFASNAGIIKSTDGQTLSFIWSGDTITSTTIGVIYGGGQLRISANGSSTAVGSFSWKTQQPVLNAPTAVSKNRIWTDNPPTENVTKTFTFGGVSYTMAVGYIGDVTVTDDSGWHGILLVIPVVLLASLLVAVAFVAFRRDY